MTDHLSRTDMSPSYWLVQPGGRRKFFSRDEAERIAKAIEPLREVYVVAYNVSGKVVRHA